MIEVKKYKRELLEKFDLNMNGKWSEKGYPNDSEGNIPLAALQTMWWPTRQGQQVHDFTLTVTDHLVNKI